MRTITFNLPKKVKKKLNLKETTLPINRAPSVLGLLKDFATENRGAINVSFTIIDEEGEKEISISAQLKESNPSNLLWILREAVFSEQYSEMPTVTKEEFLQEIEAELKIPIEPEKEIKTPTPPHQLTSPKINLTKTQFFLLGYFLVLLIFCAVVGYPQVSIGMLVIATMGMFGVSLWKSRTNTQAFNRSEFMTFQEFEENQALRNQNATIVPNPKGRQSQTAFFNPSVTPVDTGFETQEAVPIDDFPSQEPQHTPPKEETTPVAHDTQSEEVPVSVEGIPQSDLADKKREPKLQTVEKAKKMPPQPNLPVIETRKGEIPMLKAGNAEENKQFNIARLEKQITALMTREFKTIQDKQASIDQFEITTHDDAIKARVAIENLYQLQSDFESKWKSA